MSRIGSTSGVRVAAQPLSNIYTVLLLVALLAVVLTLVLLGYVLQTRYGGTLGYGEEATQERQQADDNIARNRADLDQMDKTLLGYSGGGGMAPPPAGTLPPPSPLGAANG